MGIVKPNQQDAIVAKLTVESKALLSAIHSAGCTSGEANSLGEIIIDSINKQNFLESSHKIHRVASYVELMYGTGSLVNLFNSTPEAPAKFRDIRIPQDSERYLTETAADLEGEWILTDGCGQTVRRFNFINDAEFIANLMTGITLAQQVPLRFKQVPQNHSLNVKARGTHIKPDDVVHLRLYAFVLSTPTSGRVSMADLIVNFTQGTFVAGTPQELHCAIEYKYEAEYHELSEDDLNL